MKKAVNWAFHTLGTVMIAWTIMSIAFTQDAPPPTSSSLIGPPPPPKEVIPKANASQQGVTILDTYRLTFDNNPDILIAKAKIGQIKGQTIGYESKLLPQVTVGGMYLPLTLEGGATQVLYSRAILPIIHLSGLLNSAAMINVQLVTSQVMANVRTAFANALYAQERHALYKERLALLKDRSSHMPALFEAGRITKTDINTLTIRISVAELDVKQAETDAKQALINLNLIMGIGSENPHYLEPVVGAFPTQPEPQPPLPQLIDTALKNRFDLQALTKLKLAADQNIRIVGANDYPIVAAFTRTSLELSPPGPFETFENDLSTSLHRGNTNAAGKPVRSSSVQYGVNISWRIFDAGDTLGKVRAARAQTVQQDILKQQTEKAIPGQVTGAYQAVQDSAELSKQLASQDLPEQNLHMSHSAFEAGVISQLEVLDAVDQNIDYRLNSVLARYYLELASIQLEEALGNTVYFQTDNK